MRGKLAEAAALVTFKRNIPAYAGKTIIVHRDTLLPTEHPRVCGENAVDAYDEIQIAGTSPRMRGKLAADPTAPLRERNIPAYAGKTTLRDIENGVD